MWLCLQQKIVMQVHMNCQKCQTKALKVAASANGELNKRLVIGDGIDAMKLTNSLRQKVGQTNIISLAEVKAS